MGLVAKLGEELEQPGLDHCLSEPGDDTLQGAYELRSIAAADQAVELAFVRDRARHQFGHHGLPGRRQRERIGPAIAQKAFADHVAQAAQVIEDRRQARRVAADGGRQVALRQAGIGIDQVEDGKAPGARIDAVRPAGIGLERRFLRQPQMQPDGAAQPTEVDVLRQRRLLLRQGLELGGGTAGHRGATMSAN